MLIAIVRDTEGERVSQFADEPIEIGRHGTLRLADKKVSKHHARLQRDGADWFVEDMGSRNGTFVNGIRVDGPRRVKEGDKLQLGSAQMIISKIIESQRGEAPAATPPELHFAPKLTAAPAPPPSPEEATELSADAFDPGPPLDLDAATPAQLDLPASELDSAPTRQRDVATSLDFDAPWTPEPGAAPLSSLDPPDAAPLDPIDSAPPPAPDAAPLDPIDAAPEPALNTPPPPQIMTLDDSLTTTSDATPSSPAPDLSPPRQPEPNALSARAGVPAPPAPTGAKAESDEIALAAWLHALPVKRDVIQSMTPAMDPAVLSIRPLAQERSSATPAWRRAMPYAALVLVLLALAANLLLLVLFRGEARRDASELREALARQDQSSAEAVLRELREELRAPSAQQLQAWQALGDNLAERHAALTEKLRADLAADRQATAQLAAARQDDRSAPTADNSRAALMRELAEIKDAIAALKQAAPREAAPQQAAAIAEPTAAAGAEAPAAEDAIAAPAAPAPAPPPPAAASPVPAGPAASPVVAPAAETKPLAQTFLIDASATLQHAIPQAVDEVRRTIASGRQRGSSRILLLYQGRLIELPVAALESRDVEPLDRGAADLPAALQAALADRPPVLYVFSDTLGDVAASAAVIRQADTRGTSIHVTQFYSREHRDQLKGLARDFHGNYSFIPAR